jgi:hypothetical protein
MRQLAYAHLTRLSSNRYKNRPPALFEISDYSRYHVGRFDNGLTAELELFQHMFVFVEIVPFYVIK